MKKQNAFTTISLVAAALSLSLGTMVFAAKPGLEHFTKKNQYVQEQFADVPADSWYAKSVGDAYEYGLIKGESDTEFAPEGHITLAESITLACRLHSIFVDDSYTFASSDPWYQSYVDYAVSEGIITSDEFADYEADATREQFAAIVSLALSEEALAPINDISAIPDVPATLPGAKAIYALYRAGVLTGNDEYGTFAPNSGIQRCEVAAIVTRMANRSERKAVKLKIRQIKAQSVQLDSKKLSLEIGAKHLLSVSISPDNATEKDVTWTSSDTSVASVSQSGEVTAVKVGTAQITAKVGDVSAICSVSVLPIEVGSLTLSQTSLTLEEEQTETLSASVLPENATDKSVTWKSSNTSVAAVSASGKVTAVKAGSAQITATAGKVSVQCAVTVTPKQIKVPEIGKEYGPFTLTDYYSSGKYWQSNKVTSFVFTKCEMTSIGEYKLYASYSGTTDDSTASVYVHFFNGNTMLGKASFIPRVAPNTSYSTTYSTFVEKDIIDNATRFEFYSYSGYEAEGGKASETGSTQRKETTGGKQQQSFAVPVLDKEYGPFTLTDYYSSGKYWHSNKVTSFVFTKCEMTSIGEYKLYASYSGTTDDSTASVYVHFFNGNTMLGKATFIPNVAPNKPYSVIDDTFVEKDVIEKATRIEFYSYSGYAANETLSESASSKSDDKESSTRTKTTDKKNDLETLTDYLESNGGKITNKIAGEIASITLDDDVILFTYDGAACSADFTFNIAKKKVVDNHINGAIKDVPMVSGDIEFIGYITPATYTNSSKYDVSLYVDGQLMGDDKNRTSYEKLARSSVSAAWNSWSYLLSKAGVKPSAVGFTSLSSKY